ncbi:MAG TPA: phosphoenolpyruvate--protein phosphotransferase [bacterium]|nr:phosphoenolpyruvate--protein phosphotransferase [bacterium]
MSAKAIMKVMFRGLPVSEGIAIGKIRILESPWDEVVRISLRKSRLKKELDRYSSTLKDVEKQLIECRDRVSREIGPDEAKIFSAHLAILNDPFFQTELPEAILENRQNAENVLKQKLDEWTRKFQTIQSDYFRHRLDDIQDVAVRILRSLLRNEASGLQIKDPVILAAHSLTPSDTARMDREKILGFVTEMGGQTSHASILARSMGLPAVVGVERLLREVQNGNQAIVDGNSGLVHINPHHDIVKGYEKRQKQFNVYWKRLAEGAALPAVTEDGEAILLQANITMLADLSLAVRYQAEGIGLFRTELPFLMAGRFLSELEQFDLYKNVVQTMKKGVVTIRTLDLGGDKFLPFQAMEKEKNPFLGWRSIRIFLQERDLFKSQIRAIYRASDFGQVRILFPMISSLSEILEIRKLLEESKNELRAESIPFDEELQVGIMIEVPSAAILAHRLIPHVDFFSIGTNDLIQYTLAVDRNNEKVARFYQPLNPAILDLIRNSIQAAMRYGKSVSLCGEMAGNPVYTGMLLGMGLSEFSMSPLMLPEVKERIRAVSMDQCRSLAEALVEMDSAEQIEKRVWDFNAEVNARQSIPYMEKTGEQAAETGQNIESE